MVFNVYMDGVVREVNDRVLERGLEQPSAIGGRFGINQLLFSDDTALMVNSESSYRLEVDRITKLKYPWMRICMRIPAPWYFRIPALWKLRGCKYTC